MSASIYDYRDNEVKNERRIRRERVWAIVGLALGAPLAAAMATIWIVGLAAM